MFDLLQKRFASAKSIRVVDVSCKEVYHTHLEELNGLVFLKIIIVLFILGGCGAMFDVTVISPEFKDITMVKQHIMVTEVSDTNKYITSLSNCV